MTTVELREWDFCDQCIFFIACMKPERKRGDGCEIFYPYPYSFMKEQRCEGCGSKFIPKSRSQATCPTCTAEKISW